MTDFENLNLPEAQLANLSDLGYLKMTAVQSAALPPALAGQDIVIEAETGSGKTVAFALPGLAHIKPRDFATQTLVMCPTRELASQVAAEIRRLARFQANLKLDAHHHLQLGPVPITRPLQRLDYDQPSP